MGTLMVTLGFTSCKKDKNCTDCLTFTEDGETYTYCVGEKYVETQALFDAYVALVKAKGYSVKTSKKCD